VALELTVNGRRCTTHADPLTALARVLREELHLTGTKTACSEGFCGSCTVLVDDVPAVSCLLPVALAAGRVVRTVESLTPPGGDLAPLQQAMQSSDAVQCGMCFPGILMTLTAVLEGGERPAEAEVRAALVGNICRCTGYERIVAAALAAVEAHAGAGEQA
jgi:carbon-monoxide dehydrogenase small subunit